MEARSPLASNGYLGSLAYIFFNLYNRSRISVLAFTLFLKDQKMDKARREYINGLADIIRTGIELSVPVDVDEAVKRLNGSIKELADIDYEAKIERIGEGFEICLSIVHPNRRRFSIAHELGHLFIHMGYLLDEEKWASVGAYTDSVYYRYGFNVEETEANEFAAAFLMPKEDFISKAEQHRNGDKYWIDPIAEYFQVSNEAAINRGKWLGVFRWE
jgi:hypothetical protein